MIARRGLKFWRRRLSGPEEWTMAAIVALLFAVLFTEVTGTGTLFQIDKFDLNVLDPAFLLLCAAALRCWLDKPVNINAATIPALILAALVCVAFLRGIERDPFKGFFWLRSAGFLPPTLIIGATLRPRAETFAAIRTAIFTSAALLTLLVLLRLTIDPALFFTGDIDNASEINDGGRAISNPGAIVVGMAVVLAMGALLGQSRRRLAMPAALLAFLSSGLVLSLQATAIIATGVAVLALVILERPFRDRSVIGMAATALVALMYLTSASWAELLPISARGMIQHRFSNLGTRQAVWESFAAKYPTLSVVDRAIGIPAGSDPALIVFISGQWRPWQYSMHSMYIGLMSSVGLAGLCAYGAFMLACLAISALLARTRDRIGAFTPALSIAFLLLAAIEGFSYDLRVTSLILILLPLLLVAQARPGRRQGPALARVAGRQGPEAARCK